MRETDFLSQSATCRVRPSWRLRLELFLVRIWRRCDWRGYHCVDLFPIAFESI